ncbi:MAG: site-2 protease family protein [Promethearchaeota archaeon]
MNFSENILIGIITHPWFIISLLFWLIILILVILLRKKKDAVYVFFPLIALLKTKKLNKMIQKISQKYPKFWRIFWTIGIFVSFTFIIFAIYFFFINLILLIFNPKPENVVAPVIPGVTIDIPIFMYFVLPILFVMTTHELAHGIAASTDGVDVKSTGVLGAGFFYLIGIGAFVEVDERELYSSKVQRKTRLRIAAAGTFVNGITAGIALLLLFCFPILISPFYGKQVTQIDSVLKEEEGGFNYGRILEGEVIYAVKERDSSGEFIYLDGERGITLTTILMNESKDVKVSIGMFLSLKVYNPSTDENLRRNVKLGPKYNIGILYEYISNNELQITYIYSKEEGGNNYDKKLKEDLVITEINGTSIDVNDGDTLEKVLTDFDLKNIELTDEDGNDYLLDVEIEGVLIGVLTKVYWMPKNAIGSFLKGDFPMFLIIELYFLWVIAISITLFNMLPLPIFDGDRIMKEIIEWRVGEEYKTTKKKKDKFLYKKDEKDYGLSEYRVNKIETVNIILQEKQKGVEQSKILLGKKNYELIDKIGDGFKSTLSLKLPKQTKLKEDSIIEVTFEYWYDEKRRLKKKILNTIRVITLIIVLGNFLLSYIKFGAVTFWI